MTKKNDIDSVNSSCEKHKCGDCVTPCNANPEEDTGPACDEFTGKKTDDESMPEPMREFAEQKLSAIERMQEFFTEVAKIAAAVREKAKEDSFEAALMTKDAFYKIDALLGEHPEVTALTEVDLKKANRWFSEIAADLLAPLTEAAKEDEL